jgi:phage terminase large subunit-like protein
VLRQLEVEHGPEAVGALETAWAFWGRPEQLDVLERATTGIVVITGAYGTGKSRTGWELLVHLILIGRATAPRILAATGDDARGMVCDPKTGILAWRKPGVSYLYEPSKGREGLLTINGVPINLLSIEAPTAALGRGCDVQILDDPPKWGPTGRAALVAALKSARERGTLTIVPTTADGVKLLEEVLGVGPGELEAAGVLVVDLGPSEANAGNLDPAYFRAKAGMQRAGLWDPIASTSPWGLLTPAQWARILEDDLGAVLVETAVSIDPSKGGSSRPCEVGIVGGGRDVRDVLRVRYDRSAVLAGVGPDGWPAVAWSLAEQIHREHPKAPFPVFVIEKNVGTWTADLLYAEETARRLAKGEPGIPFRTKIVWVRAEKDKCVRAETPARVAGQGRVRISPKLSELAGQLRNLTPKGLDSDRADAANHLLTHLGRLGEGEEQVQRTQAAASALAGFSGLRDAQRPFSPPAFRGNRV